MWKKITLFVFFIISLSVIFIILELRRINQPILISTHNPTLNQPRFVPKLNPSNKYICILTIDGGGVRGVIPAHILAYLEKKTQKHPTHFFNIFAGTSTGSIIVSGLVINDSSGRPKYTAQNVLDNFNFYVNTIFETSFYYQLITLDGLLAPKFMPRKRQSIFGKIFGDHTINQANSFLIIPAFDIEQGAPVIFTNWLDGKENNIDFYLKDIVSGATSPPTFFPANKIYSLNHKQHYTLLDGGIFANNPALIALIEAGSIYPNRNNFLLLSLGTGSYSSLTKQLKQTLPQSGIIGWLPNIVELFVEATSDFLDKHTAYTIRSINYGSKKDKPTILYYRINMQLTIEQANFIDSSPKNMRLLNKLAEDYINTHQAQLDEVAAILEQKCQTR